VACGVAWEEATHPIWPSAFKAAAQTLLLAAHRRRQSASYGIEGIRRVVRRLTERFLRSDWRKKPKTSAGGGGGASLADLPPELLLRILAKAAWPMSAWL
jgi:hypothetical protein